ncbi:hypothetical protein [Akkermansia sp.]|uniref:hypothetical protein n=1 Tax=Akkermansia sp. TaxID=1872421 RepID=UPI0025ED63AA|nr:hypothetical protein [uncultured Akkermansia sp.]MBD9271095.1 hypothetical protein [Akkermansia sp.]
MAGKEIGHEFIRPSRQIFISAVARYPAEFLEERSGIFLPDKKRMRSIYIRFKGYGESKGERLYAPVESQGRGLMLLKGRPVGRRRRFSYRLIP